MTDLLYPVAPKAILPLVKGEDVDVEFIYKVLLVDGDGEPILDDSYDPPRRQFVVTDVPEGATVILVVDPNIESEPAEIDGSVIRPAISHTLVDRTPDCTLWRLVMTPEGGRPRVLVNGITQRFDGQ